MSDRLLHHDFIVFRREPRVAATVGALARSLRAAWRRQRSRHRLAGLNDHMLKDIGVSFAEAEAEANKPFWQD
jgi:uncharacterized protein YjiS (DUF1127 family)